MAAAFGFLHADDATARTQKVTLNRAACNQFVEHVPDEDVAFKPGKTVDGRDVAPADLDDGPRIELPELIPILISADLQDEYHLPFDSPLFDANTGIGLLVYDRSRRLFTFNGIELGDPEQRFLAAQCRAAGGDLPAR
ncbi:MAG: hypothetical protein ACKVOI_07895 [Dongiaceae bacterium]